MHRAVRQRLRTRTGGLVAVLFYHDRRRRACAWLVGDTTRSDDRIDNCPPITGIQFRSARSASDALRQWGGGGGRRLAQRPSSASSVYASRGV